MRRALVATAAVAAMWAGTGRAAEPPRLLQHPSLSATQIAFDYAGEIWTVPRAGGQATPVVVGQGQNSRPIFSPDGRWIAYSGRYDGNTDVYVVPAGGGEPKRLTWHPDADVALAWTPDGKRILFRSTRQTNRDYQQLFTIAVEGGQATMAPLPSGAEGSYSADGTHLAYLPFQSLQPAWKQYRGGSTPRVWIANLADSKVEKLPRENSNDRNPMWVGDTVYFLSDRDGPVTLFGYDTRTKAVKRLIDNSRGFDIASAQAGPGGIVYDAFGALKVYDLASGQSATVPVTIASELPQTRPHMEALRPDQILNVALTPSGKRVLVEAHGEILSAPAEKGDVRNLTASPAVADRDPAASPDGKQVAWFSDEGGEYALHVRSADGIGPTKKIALGDPPSFFYAPRWSPDSGKIAFYDKRLNIWLVDVAKGGAPVKVDTDRFDSPAYAPDPSWSPDSRFLTYVKQLPSHQHAAFVYPLETGKAVQVTDGLSDVASPRFDRSGDYLYFTASTSTGLAAGWLDMSSNARPADGSVYAIVLRKDLPSPVGPESDEEGGPADAPKTPAPGAAKPSEPKPDAAKDAKNAKDKAAEAKAPVKPMRIDFDRLDQRVVALPIPRARFADLMTGDKGVVFTVTQPLTQSDDDVLESQGGPDQTLFRFDMKTRKNEQLAEGLDNGSIHLSADGTKLLYARKKAWVIAGSDKPIKPADETKVNLAGVQVFVDPRAEWKQMFHETWRIERDFLYDPKAQGLDLARAEKLYGRYVDGLGGRQDLNTLFEEMTGQLGLGHVFIRGGAMPAQTPVKVGLLGADYEVDGGHYRIKRILRGENWNPKLTAPLSQPGVNVAEGEFLLAVNDRPVIADREVYGYFEGLAGKQTVITVGPNADGSGSRKVTVVPTDSETALRLRTWMEANRRKVDELSGGKLAYVYLPDTANGGYANFNRYYYSQVGKQGVVVDERFNHGGQIADYIVDQLTRTIRFANATREGEDMFEPAQVIYGPRVMVINESSGSGGDALPYLFRQAKAGPLVGTRTWGGLVGIGGYPPLIDGGSVTAPRWALISANGQLDIEDVGVPPDVEVEQDPAAVRAGHDPQLERAVAMALEALPKAPQPKIVHPPYPDRKPVLPE